jgi:hypothetical protein
MTDISRQDGFTENSRRLASELRWAGGRRMVKKILDPPPSPLAFGSRVVPPLTSFVFNQPLSHQSLGQLFDFDPVQIQNLAGA